MNAKGFVALLFTLWVPVVAHAWQPSGWTYWSWPYAYDAASVEWYWMNSADSQWAFGYPPASGWNKLGESGLASGWSWWAWPYVYDSELGAWYYVDETGVQWCVNLATGQWAKLGQNAAPVGMVLIAAGSFEMGATTNVGHESNVGETPQHTVFVSGYYMDQYEVTKALWDDVASWANVHGYDISATTVAGKAPNHPVHSVSWYQSVKWCNARSEREGLTPCYTTNRATYRTEDNINLACNWTANGYRLPTEAEWEKAARGGAASHRFTWSDTDTIQHARANYYSSTPYAYDTSPTRGYHPTYATGAEPYTSPVGSFAANGYGLYDMAGNVSEWCWDWWYTGFYAVSPAADPRGSTYSPLLNRIHRGGCWNYASAACRVADRGYSWSSGSSTIGFRCVRKQ